MEYNSYRELQALIEEKPLTEEAVRRLMNSSRHIAHTPAGSRPQDLVRPVETRVLGKHKQKKLLRRIKNSRKLLEIMSR